MNYYLRKSPGHPIEGPLTVRIIHERVGIGTDVQDWRVTGDIGETREKLEGSPESDWISVRKLLTDQPPPYPKDPVKSALLVGHETGRPVESLNERSNPSQLNPLRPPPLKQPCSPPQSVQTSDQGHHPRAQNTPLVAAIIGALFVGITFAVGLPFIMFYGDPHLSGDFASIAVFGIGILAGHVGLVLGAIAGWLGFKAVDHRAAMTRGAILGACAGVLAAFIVFLSMPLFESVLELLPPLVAFLLCTGAVALAGKMGFYFFFKR